MKKLIVLMFATVLSLPVFAGYTGHTEVGPRVDCHMSDGSVDFLPTNVCTMKGGKY
ncbi:hypothetical protein [Vibrio mexicanus]|uniref:hypothetical protein n=1 Tax=Vibrio mexicanus TaxID=1004326 RepID=UPI000A6C19A8|nr:hypothetical protein [Vibrio mexicanus]